MSDPNARARRAPAAGSSPGGIRAAKVAPAPAFFKGSAAPDEATEAPAPAAQTPEFEGQYRVELPTFEGPLDLLLHLIQQHELDILDIPVSFITEKYLAYLKLMQTLSIDVASEYLVMAATLTHMKSKMLLPSVPAGQEDDGLPGEEQDPRAELVRRLLEYQKYKAAAAELGERGTLGRDVFPRGAEEPVPDLPAPFAPLGVFSLLDAFDKVLQRTKVKFDHEVVFDRVSITDRMLELSELLSERKSMRFEDLFTKGAEAPTRFDLVITFLALLEMAKLRMIRVYQSDPLSPLHVELAAHEPGEPGSEGFGPSTEPPPRPVAVDAAAANESVASISAEAVPPAESPALFADEPSGLLSDESMEPDSSESEVSLDEASALFLDEEAIDPPSDEASALFLDEALDPASNEPSPFLNESVEPPSHETEEPSDESIATSEEAALSASEEPLAPIANESVAPSDDASVEISKEVEVATLDELPVALDDGDEVPVDDH